MKFGPPILITTEPTQALAIFAKRDSRFAPAIGVRMVTLTALIVTFVWSGLIAGSAAIANSSACPFCASVNLTFTDQIAAKDVVVSAKLIDAPPLPDDPDADLPMATFEITKVLKGDKFLEKGMEFQALLVGRHPKGRQFLVMGLDPPDISWTTPIKASPVLLKYLEDIQNLPESGSDRLAFFQDFFEHEESSIAFDAYDEFAKAPYADLVGLKDRMPRRQLLTWIGDKETSINRRRLYLTMLGVCGTTEDGNALEKMIADGGDANLRGLDALVACYLCLKGDAGVELVEKKFLVNEESDFTSTMGAVSALRFHGTEVDVVSRDRIIAAVRKLLDRPKMADLIISDLARWADWSSTDKLVKMFKESKDDNRWLRVPIVAFLMASPEPRAKEYLAELKTIDPGSIERAELFGGGFEDDDDDDDSDVDLEDADVAEPQSQSSVLSEQAASMSFISAGNADDNDPFAELDREIANESIPKVTGHITEVMPAKSPSIHTSYKVPLTSDEPSVATLPTTGPTGQTLDRAEAIATVGEKSDNVPSLGDGPSLSIAQGESSPIAVAAEATSPVATVAPVTPVAVVPYLTLKIILIPFACSVLLFFLLWSVVNGSFQRLIF